jgi:hypothetical protein
MHIPLVQRFTNKRKNTFDVAMNNFLVVQVFETLQNLFRVIGDGSLVPLQRTPFRTEQSRQGTPGYLEHIKVL